METNDKIKTLKEQALDWIEKELSYNPKHVPIGIEDAFLEEDYGELESYLGWSSDCPEPLADILREILKEVRLQEFRKKRLRKNAENNNQLFASQRGI